MPLRLSNSAFDLLGSRSDIGTDELPSRAVVYLPFVIRSEPPPPPPPPPEIPVYYLEARQADLDWLAQDPYRNETIPATFCVARGARRCWNVDIRYRGDTSRRPDMLKKSWKIFFPGSDPFRGQLGVSYEMNLNADYVDQTLLRTHIAYGLFESAGVPTPRVGYARLYINGAYYGLFVEVEQIDERFLDRQGVEMHGNLYKPYYGNLGTLDHISDPWKRLWWYRYYYPKKTNRDAGIDDIIAFIELINRTPDADFARVIGGELEVNGWLDWYAVNVLIGNYEMTNKNYYLYHDLSAGRWMILPWDVDIALGHNEGNPWGLFDRDISWDNPIDTGANPKSKYNALIDHMMRVPEFRLYHCRRLRELMAGPFSPAALFPRIDATYEFIYEAAMADPNRWRPELSGPYPSFEDGPAELKTYVANRIAFLEGAMAAFCPAFAPPPTINELLAGPDGWIELYNASPAVAWDVGGMYLTDDVNEPRKQRIPAPATIPPGGTLLLRTDFTLDPAGGQVGLFDADLFGNAPLALVTYAAQTPGVSYGRWPDGGADWRSCDAPTPGRLNAGLPPLIGTVVHTPTAPTASDPVLITAVITDEGAVAATLWYRAFAPHTPRPAYRSVPLSGEGTLRQASIPPQPAGTWVEYYAEVVDEAGMRSVSRPGWPQGDYRYIVGWQRPPIYINEAMAINDDTLEDEQGRSGDWIELYNAGPDDVDVGGLYLSDNIENDTLYTIPPNTVIPAGGYRILWADGSGTGGHLNFKLGGAGGYIGLFDSQARYYAPVDALYYGPLAADLSWGRFPDGDGADYRMALPTPGGPNRLTPPQFSRVTRVPRWPGAGDDVTLTAAVSASLPLVSVALWYDAGEGFRPLTPTLVGAEWRFVLPPQPAGALVSYYLVAEDGAGERGTYPPDAPAAAERYLVGYAPPPLLINELLADNAAVNADEAGEYDDWVEIYNAGDFTATLDGLYLSDDLTFPMKWAFPAGTVIPPRGYLLIWCDRSAWQGPLHADFRLDRQGEAVGLFDSPARGTVALDWVAFGPQEEDVSYARRPDGAEMWGGSDDPTPGAANR